LLAFARVPLPPLGDGGLQLGSIASLFQLLRNLSLPLFSLGRNVIGQSRDGLCGRTTKRHSQDKNN
jgi:hypothetical protein